MDLSRLLDALQALAAIATIGSELVKHWPRRR